MSKRTSNFVRFIYLLTGFNHQIGMGAQTGNQ